MCRARQFQWNEVACILIVADCTNWHEIYRSRLAVLCVYYHKVSNTIFALVVDSQDPCCM